jgi:hypothetical protein
MVAAQQIYIQVRNKLEKLSVGACLQSKSNYLLAFFVKIEVSCFIDSFSPLQYKGYISCN